jgi:hypothetical protein
VDVDENAQRIGLTGGNARVAGAKACDAAQQRIDSDDKSVVRSPSRGDVSPMLIRVTAR